MAIVNVLLTTFAGLGLPPTLSLAVSALSPVSDLLSNLLSQLPHCDTRFIITTSSNRPLVPSANPIISVLSSHGDDFLPLRLSVPVRGGKGGFGSQLRAAGGRMSSKRKNNQGDNNGSSRNLDGRRLRTVTEAKALAEYLALKPEMDKKEKEDRRKRWQQVVDMAEQREEEVRSSSKAKLSGQWIEDKEEASDRTREAVSTVMDSGGFTDNLIEGRSGSGTGNCDEEQVQDMADDTEAPNDLERVLSQLPAPNRTDQRSMPSRPTFLDFDDEDEAFLSDQDEDG